MLGLNKKEVGRLTYRTFKNLYYHYQNYYDFTLAKISYQRLEEINMENRYEFLANGGQEFNYIPAFNESEAFAEILKELVIKEIK